jgi:hypothetical protein
MADNVNVAMGIGLQGQLTAPNRIFAAQEAEKQYTRKLNLAAQKEKDDELEAIKKKILIDKPKIHRLLANDISTKTAEALKGMVEAKQNSPNDYLSKIYDIYGNLQGTLNDAVGKSAVLTKFETDMTSTTGQEYVASGVKNAYGLMSKANNLDEWYSKMQSAGIKNNDFFQYSPETQAFNYAVVPRVDPNAYAKTVTSQHAKDPYGIEEKFVMIGGKQKKERKILYGMVDDRKTADEIFQSNVKLNGGNINNAIRPFSGDEAAVSYFNQPGAAQQYADMHPEVTSENIVQHYKDNYFIPNKKNSMGIDDIGTGGLNITQNVSTGGGDEKATYFAFDGAPNTYKAVGKDVTSIGKMALSKNNIPYEGSVSQQFFNPVTGKPAPGSLKNAKLVIGELLALPVETNADGSIKLIKGSINFLKIDTLEKIKQVNTKISKGEKLTKEEEAYKDKYFKIKPMAVLRDKNNLGAAELLDDDLVTEFKNIKSTFYLNIPAPTKTLNSRKEFEDNYNLMMSAIKDAEGKYRPMK